MVRPNGFEPSARSLGNCCSIHLSYGRVRIYCTKSHSCCKDWLYFPFGILLILFSQTRRDTLPCLSREEAFIDIRLQLDEPLVRNGER